jgi:hypothetical protein
VEIVIGFDHVLLKRLCGDEIPTPLPDKSDGIELVRACRKSLRGRL